MWEIMWNILGMYCMNNMKCFRGSTDVVRISVSVMLIKMTTILLKFVNTLNARV